MKYNKLGKTDMSVSKVCLGTMTWGSQNTEGEAHEQMDYALDQGVNFFDTAELYSVPPQEHTQGLTESYVGSWFKKSGNREKIILATKVAGKGLPWIDDGDEISAKRIELAIDRSLKRLQTDYLDLYQLHWPNRPFPHFGNHGAGVLDHTTVDINKETDDFLSILHALDRAIKSGKIRSFGVSNDTPWGVMKYLEIARNNNLPEVTSIQNEYSLMYRHDEPYMAETCVHEQVSYLPYSPLVCGSISGKYLGGARPDGARWSLGIDGRPNQRDTDMAGKAIKLYMQLAKNNDLDVCQMALAFCYQQSFITSTIIGATTMDQLKSNISAVNIELSDEVLKGISAIHTKYPMPY